MKLIYLGKELDVTKHYDLNSTNEFGFDVTVRYLPNKNHKGRDGTLEIWHNINQVDNLYDNDFDCGVRPDQEHHIAFESYIQETGGWRHIEELESVTVTLANKLYAKNRIFEYPEKAKI